MSADDLALSVERHATSKLDEEDLFDIRSLGFRGEALPSIGSIAQLDDQLAARATPSRASPIVVDRGAQGGRAAGRASIPERSVEVRDLFSATPARLKFLKSERAESDGRHRCRASASPWRIPTSASRCRPAKEARRLARGERSSAAWLDAHRRHHGPRVHRRCAGSSGAEAARRRRCASSALPDCRRCTGPTARSSFCSSTAAR